MTMARMVNGWMTDDGSIFVSEAAAKKHERETEFNAFVRNICASNKLDCCEDEFHAHWDTICEAVHRFEDKQSSNKNLTDF